MFVKEKLKSGIYPGIYETVYGNACKYIKGDFAYDLDMAEKIPIEMVDFSKYIRKLD